MKIILSPSKTQIKESTFLNKEVSILFEDETIKLFKKLKRLTKNEIQLVFKIKGKLLDDTYKTYQDFKLENTGINAIDCYKGVVYEQINHLSYNKHQQNYLNSNLRLLSAMYGILEPNSIIWPYRLDMTIKIKGLNLYNYWQDSMDNYFQEEDYIINLASKEFSKMIKLNKDKLIHIHFLEEQKDHSLKVISYNAKKARGTMANKIIENLVEDYQEIKKYQIDGYIYKDKLSNDKNLYYIKPTI